MFVVVKTEGNVSPNQVLTHAARAAAFKAPLVTVRGALWLEQGNVERSRAARQCAQKYRAGLRLSSGLSDAVIPCLALRPIFTFKTCQTTSGKSHPHSKRMIKKSKIAGGGGGGCARRTSEAYTLLIILL